MTIYIFKAMLCPAIFLLIYLLLLEKEKMHFFNRGFLLFGLVFSFVIPLCSIQIGSAIVRAADSIDPVHIGFQRFIPSGKKLLPAGNGLFINVLLIAYVTVTLFQLSRFIGNILYYSFKIRRNKSVQFEGVTLTLLPGDVFAHSFWQFIFIGREQFEKGAVEREILCHEMAHVRQRHSVDVLLMEIILVFAWFNPFLYLYRKAIRLNHEFLADDRVIGMFGGVTDYQQLLLNNAKWSRSLPLSSRLNYLMTKKRLIMMTRQTSFKAALLRQLAVIPILAAIGFLFINKVAAQDTAQPIKGQQMIGSTPAGVAQRLVDEYNGILGKYAQTGREWRRKLLEDLTAPDRVRLEVIFKQMSKTQQKSQDILFLAPMPPLPKITPNREQLKSWEDAGMYGVWVDEKKVDNTKLANFSPSAFSQVSISKLSRDAIHYGKYYYQVDLMTKDYYDRYYHRTLLDTATVIAFREARSLPVN